VNVIRRDVDCLLFRTGFSLLERGQRADGAGRAAAARREGDDESGST
jgi:hypothetical protein